MTLVKCDHCGVEFEKKQYYIKRTKHNYCCQECRYKGQHKTIKTKCDYCGKEVIKSPCVFKRINFCCRGCFDKYRNKREFIIKDNYAVMTINSVKYGIYNIKIDIEDIEKVKQYTWHILAKGNNKKCPYVRGKFKIGENKYKNVFLHKFLMDANSEVLIDHINRDTLDNRKCNLRVANKTINAQNKNMQPNKLGLNGLSKAYGSDCFYARIRVGGNFIKLGKSKNKYKAYLLYLDAKKKYHPYSVEAVNYDNLVKETKKKIEDNND